MAKAAQVTAILFGVLALGCVIASLATNHWMKACLGMNTLMDLASSVKSDISSQIGLTKTMFGDKDLCYEVGLFKVQVSLPPIFSLSLPIPIASLENFIKITGGLLIGGSLLVLIGILLLAISALSMTENSLRKKLAAKKHYSGVAMLSIGTLCLLAGTIAYTVPQTKTLHDPVRFLSQIGNSLQQSFSSLGSSMPSMPSSSPMFDLSSLGINQNGRKKRELSDLGSIASNMFDSSPDLSSLSNNLGGIPNAYKSFLSAIDPTFDYSFFLAWIGCILALLATIVGALGSRKLQNDNVDIQTVPLV